LRNSRKRDEKFKAKRNSIQGIEKLTQLTTLDLSSNKIVSIRGIENLTQLIELSLSSNQIVSIQGIENLTKLTWLTLSSNQIVSIRGIQNLTNLTKLYLSSNEIVSIRGIENLTQLIWLDLRSNQIVSIQGIEKLAQLTKLSLSNNQIVSIRGIENLTQLIELSLSSNQIVSIQGIENLTKLTWLTLSSNQIVSIQGIQNLTQLTWLDLSSNRIVSIQGIENLINLFTVDLRFNKIVDIKQNNISNNKAKFLILMNNCFKKISNYSLVDFQVVETINFDNNEINEVEPMAFYSLNNLTYLSFKNNSIKIIYDFYFNNRIHFDISANNVLFIYETSFKQSLLFLDFSTFILFKDLSFSYFNMYILHLGNQKIDKIMNNTFKGSFSKLDLSFNLIRSSSIEFHSFGYLPNLNEIYFTKNLIDNLDFNEAFQFNMTQMKLLNFDNNKISSNQNDFFSKFSNLSVLLLSHNYFSSLKSYYFNNLERLEYLNLSNNQILTIEKNTFANLVSLICLNLSNNLIYDLSQSLFSNLSRLETLILSQNQLESIENLYFYGLTNLKHLDLTHNKIKLLYNDSFHAIFYLESLFMKSNLIEYLNNSLLILKNLSTLDLSLNKLDSFKSGDVCSMITSLDLSFNPLKQFDHNQSNLIGLKSLKLSSTNSGVISNINFELFSQLEELDLSDNLNTNKTGINKLVKLNKINLKNTNSTDCSFLSYLNNTKEINVGDNNYFCFRYIQRDLVSLIISNISLMEISGFDNLKILDASYNNISSMKSIVYNDDDLLNKDLSYLNLKFNMIDDIKVSEEFNFNFHKLTKLEYINLNKSVTESLSNFKFKFGNNLENAILSSNNLRIFPKFCNQDDLQKEILEFTCKLKNLHFDHNKLNKINLIDFLPLDKLEYLNLHSNNISLIDDYSFSSLKSLESLILSNNELNLANNTQVLFNSLTNIKLLNLSFNSIEFIRVNTFQNILKIEVLDLSYNRIHSIKEGSFKGLINLKDLYLNGNEPDIKIENASFHRFEAIKTIFIDRSILNNSNHKSIFIDMVKNKNVKHNKTILKWIYYPSFNLISVHESFYDCGLVFELIRFNIQYNLKTESDITNYLANCHSSNLKRKDFSDYIIQDIKITIDFLNLFLVMLGFFILLVLIFGFYLFIRNPKRRKFLYAFIGHLKIFFKVSVSFIFNLMKRLMLATKKIFSEIFRRLFGLINY
jgi:Leucine-rich repeat (LRR) protein